MHKRIITLLFFLALLMMSACGHTHTAEKAWSFDTENHWLACKCGKVMELEAHTLDNSLCSGCGCEVIFAEDGNAQISRYDEAGNCTLSISYIPDGSGKLVENLRQEYEWNAKGDISVSRDYRNGMLIWENKHEYDSSGKITGYLITEYWEDESKVVYQYDANMQLIRQTAYDPAGNEISG